LNPFEFIRHVFTRLCPIPSIYHLFAKLFKCL